MIAYIVRRLLLLPIVIFGLIVLIFGMYSLLDPYQKAAVFISDVTELKNRDINDLIEEYGLNDPPWVQFARWFNQVIHGDLGWSETAYRPVTDAFKRFLPQSAELAIWSTLPIILGGIWLGVFSAVRQNRPEDHAMRVFAVVGWSLPTFVAGLLALFLLYGVVQWFPPGRLGLEASNIVHSDNFHLYTGIITLDAILNGNWFVFADALRHLVLPVIVLAYVSWALILRVTRSSMLETLRQEYVMTARAKGLRERVVIKKHARRNALIPVATISGLTVAFLFNGLVITETIFDLPGLGRWAADAARQFDLPALLGYLLFNGFLIVMANLIVDIMYAYIDPRVRLE
ncbi:TPA: ABC transporter permease [Candidatus Bipolaricaulota bacterium]|nr:ABC transporter permease [Candidatus Bipolaricaulota bacterium]